MKLKTIIVTAFIIASFFLNGQSFVKVGGQATDIAMSPKDGSVYVVNASKNIKKYDSRSKKFLVYGKQSKNATSVAVHSNGSVYMTSTSNEVYIDVNGRWIKIPGIKTKEIDIDKQGNIRALDLSGKLKKLFQGQWKDQNLVNRNTSGFNQVIGKDSKILFARFKDNKFKQFKSGKWNTLNGSPLKITIDDKTGKVYAVGRNKGIYEWKDTSNKWVLLKNTRKDFKDVAVHNGKIWAVATDGRIYYYDENIKASSSNPKDYAGTYVVTISNIVMRSGLERDFYGVAGVRLKSRNGTRVVTINPESGLPPRFLDIPKGNPIKPRKLKKPVYGKDLLSAHSDGIVFSSMNYEYGYFVGATRMFVLGEADASKDAEIEFQINLVSTGGFKKNAGGWFSVNLKLGDIKLGKDYIIYKNAPFSATNMCFKVEKR